MLMSVFVKISTPRHLETSDGNAIVRIEQLFPLPKNDINNILLKYINVDDIVWAHMEEQHVTWVLWDICYYT